MAIAGPPLFPVAQCVNGCGPDLKDGDRDREMLRISCMARSRVKVSVMSAGPGYVGWEVLLGAGVLSPGARSPKSQPKPGGMRWPLREVHGKAVAGEGEVRAGGRRSLEEEVVDGDAVVVVAGGAGARKRNFTCAALAAAGTQCFASTHWPPPKPPAQAPCVGPTRPDQPWRGLASVRLLMLPVLNQLSFRQSTGSPRPLRWSR